jgi:hypothetical protein
MSRAHQQIVEKEENVCLCRNHCQDSLIRFEKYIVQLYDPQSSQTSGRWLARTITEERRTLQCRNLTSIKLIGQNQLVSSKRTICAFIQSTPGHWQNHSVKFGPRKLFQEMLESTFILLWSWWCLRAFFLRVYFALWSISCRDSVPLSALAVRVL